MVLSVGLNGLRRNWVAIEEKNILTVYIHDLS